MPHWTEKVIRASTTFTKREKAVGNSLGRKYLASLWAKQFEDGFKSQDLWNSDIWWLKTNSNGSIGLSEISSNTWRDPESAVAGGLWTAEHSFKHGSGSQRCPQTPEEILRAQSLVDCEQLSIHSNSSIGLSEMSSNTWRDPESAVAGGLWTAEHSFKHGSGSQRCPQTPEEILRAQSLVDCEQLSIHSNMARVHRVTSHRRFGRDGLRIKAHSVYCWHCSALKERSVLTRCHTPYR